MQLPNSTRKSRLSMWVAALSMLALTACSLTPTKPLSPLPQLVAPKVVKPLSDMQPLQQPSPPPATLSTLTPDQQATTLFRLYTGMASYAGQCSKSRDSLIDWINRQ